MRKHIPNALTLSNLVVGCLGIYFALEGSLIYAAYTIWIAAVFDFLDGFLARLLKVSSPIGKELDSLADMVTFGVLPSFILIQMIEAAPYSVIGFIPLIIAVFSALRLAQFNIDDSQSDSFLGVPTPAVAFFVSGIPFWKISYPQLFNWYVIIGLSVILAALLVTPVRMLALKFKNYSIAANWPRYLIVLSSIILLLVLGPKALPVAISIYIILSLFAPAGKAIKM